MTTKTAGWTEDVVQQLDTAVHPLANTGVIRP